MKKNCWDIMKCKRETSGKPQSCGQCPAARASSSNGINGGEYGGRFCWTYAGTFCGGEVQGSLAKKLQDCRECVFFMLVEKEEGEGFVFKLEEETIPRKDDTTDD